jgi:hypothetical protein
MAMTFPIRIAALAAASLLLAACGPGPERPRPVHTTAGEAAVMDSESAGAEDEAEVRGEDSADGYAARIAGLEQRLRRALEGAAEAGTSSSGSRCDKAAELRDRICELARRICEIAGQHPDERNVAQQCHSAERSCESAHAAVDECE